MGPHCDPAQAWKLVLFPPGPRSSACIVTPRSEFSICLVWANKPVHQYSSGSQRGSPRLLSELWHVVSVCEATTGRPKVRKMFHNLHGCAETSRKGAFRRHPFVVGVMPLVGAVRSTGSSSRPAGEQPRARIRFMLGFGYRCAHVFNHEASN